MNLSLTSKNFLRGALALAITFWIAEARAGIVTYQIANAQGGNNAGTSGYQDLNTESVTMDGAGSTVFAGGIVVNQNQPYNNTGLPNSYTTVCTDINGTVYLGQTYNYTAPTSFGGAVGIDPTWGADNTQSYLTLHGGVADTTSAGCAIQNAAYIFNHFGGPNLATTGLSGTATYMADLQLAVWEALYDTSASGAITGTRFTTSDSAAQTVINGWFAQLAATGNAGKFGIPGYLMFPTPNSPLNNNADGEPPQELLIAASAITPVPEPTTMIAGAFLLFPFGISTMRFLRRTPTT